MDHTQVLTAAPETGRPRHPAAEPERPQEVSGYQLQERLGVGGYGEVWRAIGPGGFSKAIKILYGHTSGPQAESELRSLMLMRELRHPFLLNVERVEISDGRMVVVTELADRSLEQRFTETVRTGGRGIPRDELLAYLRDVADALDFMTEQHGLQHLDIKPGNLLIQGNHAKVGDFGLTKHLGIATTATIKGFTPLYVPPELLEGQPCSSSDQYSLAIVYQVMLTGVPPFNGRTTAQLTSQHLSATPDLSALPSCDRGVVARALSRNPSMRFSGCRQFVDELAKRRPAGSSAIRVLNASAAGSINGLTQTVDPATVGRSASAPVRPAEPLSPAGCASSPVMFRPTLFVAVGGLGVRIAQRLKRKLRDQRTTSIPATLAFLNIDTDRQGLAATDASTPNLPEVNSEALHIPLRTPAEYRRQASEHLRWLSRRWLFNIPRSGNVDGMRPLGRLAFVDHRRSIQEAILRLLQSITSKAAVEQATTALSAPVTADQVDICLIGSTSGGTASGILLDLGFLARQILNRQGLQSSRVTALLVHSTSIGGQTSDAQDANSVCFLKEMNYYSLPGSQIPAEAGGATPAGGRPFDSTVFVHCGDDLSTANYEKHVDALGDYLAAWTGTSARAPLEAWRALEQSRHREQRELRVRALGLATVDVNQWNAATWKSEFLAMQLMQRWLDLAVTAANSPISLAERRSDGAAESSPGDREAFLESLFLKNEQIVELLPSLLRGDMGRRVETYAADVWKRASQECPQNGDPARLVGMLAGIVSSDASAGSLASDSVARMTQTVRQELQRRTQQLGTRLHARLLQDVDKSPGFEELHATIATCLSRVDAAITSATAQKADVQQTFADLCASFLPADGASASDAVPRSFCQQYCMLIVCQTVCQSIIAWFTGLREFLNRQQTEIMATVRNELQQAIAVLGRNTPDQHSVRPGLLDEFASWQSGSGKFRLSGMLRNSDSSERAAAVLTADATAFLLTAGEPIPTTGPAEIAADRSRLPASAHPLLSNVGGGRRVLARIPETLASDRLLPRLQAEFGDCVVCQTASQPAVTLICEVEGIYVPTILDELTHLRPRALEMADRIHTRCDIGW
jgi:hypothetical protein